MACNVQNNNNNVSSSSSSGTTKPCYGGRVNAWLAARPALKVEPLEQFSVAPAADVLSCTVQRVVEVIALALQQPELTGRKGTATSTL